MRKYILCPVRFCLHPAFWLSGLKLCPFPVLSSSVKLQTQCRQTSQSTEPSMDFTTHGDETIFDVWSQGGFVLLVS